MEVCITGASSSPVRFILEGQMPYEAAERRKSWVNALR